MAAPVPTTRIIPPGLMLKNGYQSLITISGDPDINLWEKTVQPFSLDKGDAIDITTQHNLIVTTKAPNALFDLADGQATVAYDPSVLAQLLLQLGIEQTITYTLPNGGKYAVFGFFKSWVPAALARGTHPEATLTIVHTNVDPTDGSEASPVYVAPV